MRIALHTRSLILISSATLPSQFFTKPLHSSHSLLIKRSLHNLKPPVLMASDNLSSSPSAVVEDDVTKYGFDRAEMYSTDLAGTVESYERHVFLCYKSPEEWPSRIEASNEDPLPKLLAATMKARKQDITVKTKVTICGRGEGHDGDVYIFPDMIKYEALKESDIDGFVEEVLVNGKPWSSGEQIHFGGSFVFVCAHGSRDKRCGVCGPDLIKKLQEEIASRGLESQVFVNSCSHIGGHKYAGNVIIFRPDSEGKSTCNWYGYVTPDDVPALLDDDIAKGEIIERLWRGKMGAAAKEDGTGEVLSGQEAGQNPKLNEVSKDQASNNASFSCCAGANGVTCCQDADLKTNGDKDTVTETKGQDKLSIWARQFEQREILTAAVVVGALATVAIAYGIYRRSG